MLLFDTFCSYIYIYSIIYVCRFYYFFLYFLCFSNGAYCLLRRPTLRCWCVEGSLESSEPRSLTLRAKNELHAAAKLMLNQVCAGIGREGMVIQWFCHGGGGWQQVYRYLYSREISVRPLVGGFWQLLRSVLSRESVWPLYFFKSHSTSLSCTQTVLYRWWNGNSSSAPTCPRFLARFSTTFLARFWPGFFVPKYSLAASAVAQHTVLHVRRGRELQFCRFDCSF